MQHLHQTMLSLFNSKNFSNTIFLTIKKALLLQIQYGCENVNVTVSSESIGMSVDHNAGTLQPWPTRKYNIIVAALFYLIHTYLFNYFLSHHITQFSTFTVSCMCNSSLWCHMIFTLLLICNASINHHTNNNYGFTYMLLLYLIVIEDPLLNDFLLRDLIKLHLQGTS